MDRIAYQGLAAVYDWLVPEELLTPAGNAAMFEDQIAQIEPGAHVLDCACGTGMLAVGLAQRGFTVSASDASPAMIERTKTLVGEHGVRIDVRQSTWEELISHDWASPFKAVFCVGNSLTHASGSGARRAALRSMRSVMAQDSVLVLTSRNWEQVRAGVLGGEETVERHGIEARVHRSWEIPATWDEPHHMDIKVGTVEEHLTFHPFTHEQLHDDLRAAGFEPSSSTYARDADRYLVTAT